MNDNWPPNGHLPDRFVNFLGKKFLKIFCLNRSQEIADLEQRLLKVKLIKINF